MAWRDAPKAIDMLTALVNWFGSRTVRRATELRSQVLKLVNEQRDILSPEAITCIAGAAEELKNAIRIRRDKPAIEIEMTRMTEVANERLFPYPHAAARENVKELLVAATVILAFTTFFLQLTKIPTGSMQPTLYGITFKDLRNDSDFRMPNWLARIGHYWGKGVSYYQVKAEREGELSDVEAPKYLLPFVRLQNFKVGGVPYRIWFPPDQLFERCGLHAGQYFQAGQVVIRLKVVAGDHLLVDRFTYNFRRPKRGEIIVFRTRGISDLDQDQLYIKRLVALSGERVRIGNDQHLLINGERLDADTPGFENVYTFSPTPGENQYFGHVNQEVADRWRRVSLASLFPDETVEHLVGPRHYVAMGDNTLNSRDSRDWGDLPQANVIGKCWFVYWPFTQRFGWAVW